VGDLADGARGSELSERDGGDRQGDAHAGPQSGSGDGLAVLSVVGVRDSQGGVEHGSWQGRASGGLGHLGDSGGRSRGGLWLRPERW
jgi:hypothetical protein